MRRALGGRTGGRRNAILIDTQRLTIAGSGRLQLASERLDAVFKPSAKDPSLFTLSTPNTLTGTLGAPRVSSSEATTLTTLGKLALGVSNPATLFLFFSDTGAGHENRCAAAVEARDAKASVDAQRPGASRSGV